MFSLVVDFLFEIFYTNRIWHFSRSFSSAIVARQDFIKLCLRHNHRDRPDALEIFKHPYLKPSKART